MSAENRRADYSIHIIISCLCTIVIVLGMAYNSLRNENISLEQEMSYMQDQSEEEMQQIMWVESDEFDKMEKRLKKLEDSVFKINKR